MERGLECYNDYKICISNMSYNEEIEGEVLPAKLFHKLLCGDDPKFKADYAKHRDCFRHAEKVSLLFIIACRLLRALIYLP